MKFYLQVNIHIVSTVPTWIMFRLVQNGEDVATIYNSKKNQKHVALPIFIYRWMFERMLIFFRWYSFVCMNYDVHALHSISLNI